MNIHEAATLYARESPPKKELRFGNLKVKIEVPAGGIRKGRDTNGKPWSQKLPYAYGRIQGSRGMDGMAVDCFIGPNETKKAYVVRLPRNNGNEDKVMLGFSSQQDAVKAFLACYGNKKKFFEGVSELSLQRLEKKLKTKRGKRICAMFQTDPWTSFQYTGFDVLPPKNTVPVENEGYPDESKWDKKKRKEKDNVKYYTELVRRQGAKTMVQTTVNENWPYGYVDGRP